MDNRKGMSRGHGGVYKEHRGHLQSGLLITGGEDISMVKMPNPHLRALCPMAMQALPQLRDDPQDALRELREEYLQMRLDGSAGEVSQLGDPFATIWGLKPPPPRLSREMYHVISDLPEPSRHLCMFYQSDAFHNSIGLPFSRVALGGLDPCLP